MDQEDCICLYYSFTQATPLHLGKSYLGDDEPTHEEVYEQAQGCRKDDPSQFNIEYHPKIAIKAQALADFITKFTVPDEEGASNAAERWMIQIDDSSA